MSVASIGSVAEMGKALREGKSSSVELTRRAIQRVRALDDRVHAFTYLDVEGAFDAASEADRAFNAGVDLGPMHGIPYALKDVFDAAGMSTTCGSRLRLHHCANADSAVTERFRAAGAVLLGKLATFEFALGGPSDDLPFPATRNPWDLDYVPGGSSSGSAAAVAAGFVPVAAGTCTTGSIRGPAAWCGVVGLKPTFGRVSRRGVFPLSPSLDHCGVLSGTVRDAAISLNILAGFDPSDAGSADVPLSDYLSLLEGGVSGLRVGVPYNLFQDRTDLAEDSRAAIERCLDLLEVGAASVSEVTFPSHDLFLACSRIIMLKEAFDIHRDDLRTRLHDFGAVAARRFATGAAISDETYADALKLKAQLTESVNTIFLNYDIVLTAISLDSAPSFSQARTYGSWPLQSTPFNVTGHPAISIPIGLNRTGMPIAVQIAARHFDESSILRSSRYLERMSGWEGSRASHPSNRPARADYPGGVAI